MKKGKLIVLSTLLLASMTSCVAVESGSVEWGKGGIGFVPLLYTSNKDGDCTSIIKGWIKSAEEHGVKITGHDTEDPNTADNSSNWSVEYTDSKFEGKVGIFPNQITDMAGLLNEAKSIVSQHKPEFLVVPCFTSEIYKGSDLATISPNTKIGATNIWYGDATISNLVNKGACESAIGQHTSYALPMIQLLYNQLEGANVYGETKISAGNVRNYFYKPWTSTSKETYLEMQNLSKNFENPAIYKEMLDAVVPNGKNGKTTTDLQTFLTTADYNYLKTNYKEVDEPTQSAKYKIGVIEMSSSSNLVKPTEDFYKEYVAPTYGFDFEFYKNDGSDVISLVNRASQSNCDAVIINCTDTDTISAAAEACKKDMYAIVCNTQVYDFNEQILLNADTNGKVSKYFVGAYGIALSEYENASKSMVDAMFEKIKLDA